MKQLLIAGLSILILSASNAQTAPKKKTAPKNPQEASVDFYIKIGGVDGESSDSLPPAPNLLTVSAGGALSQTTNTNLADGYAAQARPGFAMSIGYAREMRKSRLQVTANYAKGGVNIATGDINGDGKGDVSKVDLQYLSVPIHYQIYLDAHKRFFVGGGGYVSFLLSSKQTGRPIYSDIRNYDAGATASVGAWLGSRLMMQTGYQFGLMDIDVSESNKARNGMAFLMLSYVFYSKVKYGPVLKIKPQG